MLRRLALDIGPLRDSRPFRNVFIARTVSVFGIGMLAVSVPVQVYALTGSTVQVGAVSAAEGFALLAGFLWGGALADRRDRRRLMVRARTASGIAFALLALNAFLPSPSSAALYVLAAWDRLATGVAGESVSGIGVHAILVSSPALGLVPATQRIAPDPSLAPMEGTET